jgi:uncharacterized protein YbgA (DUF1722 family)
MNTYNVLMTIQQYIEVKANSPQEASMTAWEEYRQGKHEVDAYPEFICDECDIVEEDEE